MVRFTVLASGSKGNSTVVSGGQTRILVDAGLSCRELFRRMRLAGEAPETLDAIIITHEHMDHIGGIAVHPHLARLLPALRLTDEQLNNPAGMKPVELPADVMKAYRPIHYEGLLAIAPGVVLVKAPGHTPGSQMVYVRRADGHELLLIGDVSWRLRNLDQVRERPLFMTAIIHEDREQVLGEFEALHELMQHEPGIAIVPGHDGPAVAALAAAGILQQGFQ
jgi:glyoxylase-like metal-dependent hydrolase (beta-lactamase superfamily II)